MLIRVSTDSDLASIVAVFTESVHTLGAQCYTPEQRLAWAPDSPDMKHWRSRLAHLETLVADFDGVLGGFISYKGDGHIELLYTSPTFVRQGVASRLYNEAVRLLEANRVTDLSTEASLAARSFFEAMGFQVVEAQVVERNGVQLKRFAMRRASV